MDIQPVLISNQKLGIDHCVLFFIRGRDIGCFLVSPYLTNPPRGRKVSIIIGVDIPYSIPAAPGSRAINAVAALSGKQLWSQNISSRLLERGRECRSSGRKNCNPKAGAGAHFNGRKMKTKRKKNDGVEGGGARRRGWGAGKDRIGATESSQGIMSPMEARVEK